MANETLPETAINSQLSAGIEQKISDLEFYSVEFEDLIGFQPNIAQLRYNNKPGLTLTAGKDCLTVSFNSENNLQEIYPATGFFALYFRTDSRWEIKTVEAYEIDGTALTDAIASGFRIEDEILAPVALVRINIDEPDKPRLEFFTNNIIPEITVLFSRQHPAAIPLIPSKFQMATIPDKEEIDQQTPLKIIAPHEETDENQYDFIIPGAIAVTPKIPVRLVKRKHPDDWSNAMLAEYREEIAAEKRKKAGIESEKDSSPPLLKDPRPGKKFPKKQIPQ